LERGAVIDPELAARGRRNVVHTYVELARTVQGAKVERPEGFVAVSTPINLSFCNFALDFDIETRDEARVMRDLKAIADGKDAFRAFHLPIQSEDPTSKWLYRHGWRCQHSLIQMACLPRQIAESAELFKCVEAWDRLAVAEFMVDQFFWRQTLAMRRFILDATVASCHDHYRIGEPRSIQSAVMTSSQPDSLGLYNLCVRRNLRGKGIGRQVLRSIQGLAGHLNVPLVLQCDNSLQSWYEKMSFKKTGIVESYAVSR
jgi:ribosomal protein S18 acetylase RimI-like enzyme